MNYYIASCVFTAKNPELSNKIQEYMASFNDIQTVRCCVPGWKEKIYEEKMPDGCYAKKWRELPQSHVFTPNDTIWSLCPNCMNITEEWRKVKQVHSLWEWIDSDDNFQFPDYSGMKATLQDCWRMRDRSETHDAVRSILTKMNIEYCEIPMNREKADFCGKSLYRPQVSRNPELAPIHYGEQAKDLFREHTEEEQSQIMRDYCKRYQTEAVVCYCHYCLEGLIAGGVNGIHLAQLLFGNVNNYKTISI